MKSVITFVLEAGMALSSMFVAPKIEAEFPVEFYQKQYEKYKDNPLVLRTLLFAIYVTQDPDTFRAIAVRVDPLCKRAREYAQKLSENPSETSQTEAAGRSEVTARDDPYVATLEIGLTMIVLAICTGTEGLRQKNLKQIASANYTKSVKYELTRLTQLLFTTHYAELLIEEILKNQAKILVPKSVSK